ncbi:DNA repair protein RAD55 [Nakaseomyces bracarensis]|uniref:DNA repair protein RAD55 n=1 Tax=Nakaseomyces bracarensis TaxID=273131 RepID=A0ABR4NXR7_9SACH
MSFGVPLSQLMVETPKPIPSGIEELDRELDGGFKYKAIYEIYGPPGIGKTWCGTEVIRNFLKRDEGEVLWISTHDSIPAHLLKQTLKDGEDTSRIRFIRIKKFTELLYFYQRNLDYDINHTVRESSPVGEEEQGHVSQEKKSQPRLIIIDGFSKLVTKQLDSLEKRNCSTMHGTKCRYLIIIMTLFTKANNRNNSCHLLLDDSMNTTYNPDIASASLDEDLEMVEDGFNFFVKSQNFTYDNNKRRRLQGAKHVLRSALVANNAMGHKDNRWEIFMKRRIGLFWEWSNGKKARVALVEHPVSGPHPSPHSSHKDRRFKTTPPQLNTKSTTSIPFDISGNFIYD